MPLRRLGLVASFSPRAFLRRPGAGPRVAFVHVPKTAGATAEAMLAGAYSKAGVRSAGNYFRDPKQTSARIARARWCGEWTGAPIVAGHIPYGLFAKHLPPDTRYITFLRDPLDRVLSHYHRHVERKSRTTDSLEEALVAGIPDLNNLATRFLCGDAAPLGELGPAALEDAKANLSEFAFVGIQERFAESVALLQRRLGLGPVPYLNRHVSTERPGVDDVSERDRALIVAHNRMDIELYAFAVQLFDDAVAATDEDFVPAVEALRASSAALNQAAIERAGAWLDRELSTGATRPLAALYAAAEEDGVPEAALKHVIARSPVKKVKDRDGRKVLVRAEAPAGE
jgi:hypothetical protein